jgi:hypothetical protein
LADRLGPRLGLLLISPCAKFLVKKLYDNFPYLFERGQVDCLQAPAKSHICSPQLFPPVEFPKPRIVVTISPGILHNHMDKYLSWMAQISDSVIELAVKPYELVESLHVEDVLQVLAVQHPKLRSVSLTYTEPVSSEEINIIAEALSCQQYLYAFELRLVNKLSDTTWQNLLENLLLNRSLLEFGFSPCSNCQAETACEMLQFHSTLGFLNLKTAASNSAPIESLKQFNQLSSHANRYFGRCLEHKYNSTIVDKYHYLLTTHTRHPWNKNKTGPKLSVCLINSLDRK